MTRLRRMILLSARIDQLPSCLSSYQSPYLSPRFEALWLMYKPWSKQYLDLVVSRQRHHPQSSECGRDRTKHRKSRPGDDQYFQSIPARPAKTTVRRIPPRMASPLHRRRKCLILQTLTPTRAGEPPLASLYVQRSASRRGRESLQPSSGLSFPQLFQRATPRARNRPRSTTALFCGAGFVDSALLMFRSVESLTELYLVSAVTV